MVISKNNHKKSSDNASVSEYRESYNSFTKDKLCCIYNRVPLKLESNIFTSHESCICMIYNSMMTQVAYHCIDDVIIILFLYL